MAKKEIVSRTGHRIRFILTGRKTASHIMQPLHTGSLVHRDGHVTSFTWLGYLLHYFNSYQAFDCLSLDILKSTWGGGGGWM